MPLAGVIPLWNHQVEATAIMSSTSSKVLIIEDDRKMSDALVSGIRSAGYEVLAAST
jgi:hypothetical protein